MNGEDRSDAMWDVRAICEREITPGDEIELEADGEDVSVCSPKCRDEWLDGELIPDLTPTNSLGLTTGEARCPGCGSLLTNCPDERCGCDRDYAPILEASIAKIKAERFDTNSQTPQVQTSEPKPSKAPDFDTTGTQISPFVAGLKDYEPPAMFAPTAKPEQVPPMRIRHARVSRSQYVVWIYEGEKLSGTYTRNNKRDALAAAKRAVSGPYVLEAK